ncbi:Ku protein [Devosia neptuniae]|jgi:DNA end-binding protein Ku|uniref:non-homologous end joining protein Ku n=1 Tax=Devosia TaxID=46913 RepID=UPI0022AFC6DE|nr:Ku protein [Devosia neptuniae]MCZ4346505.1 Ku protein [Devosia neptuniae]|tara:strand:+ start:3167 stop:4018 length:852 start_codon:yes stop_codon:yes gene_type:complete
MPASRPIWKGQLRLSLVSIAVELYTATKSSAKPSFRQIHEPTGKPIHYEKVVAGVGPVDKDEIMKGFEYEKGDYVLLSNEEIDAVKLDTRKTLELTQFVGACEIDPIYFDKPYFIVPADDLAEDAFRVIRDALRASEKVGLGQLALRGKEYLVAIKPTGTGLLLETLHYEEELRKADPYFAEISAKKADAELLEVATALIEKKTAPFDAGVFKDHYQAALRELIATKLKSKSKKVSTKDEPAEAAPSGSNVVDLMAALKSSLEGSSGGKKKTPAKSAPRKKAS